MLVASLAAGAWTYVGYPVVILLAGTTRRRRDPLSSGTLPSMTVVIPAYNEGQVIERKIADTFAQEYPHDRLEVIVVADGSTDDTAAIAERSASRVLFDPRRAGKSAAVNRGVRAAGGDIVCLTDANCSLSPGALAAVARRFADDRVAVVSGTKRTIGEGALAAGEGLYWRFESRVKAAESSFGVPMGAFGELCAVRSSAWKPIPDGVINDDLFLALDALERGYMVKFVPDAVALEPVTDRTADEFERRTRIAAGTWQALIRHRSLASPRRGPAALAFWSHRILRNGVVPVLLPVTFLLSLGLARRSKLARRLLVCQIGSYAVAAAGLITDAPMAGPFAEVALMNAANVRGGWRFMTGRQGVSWSKIEARMWLSEETDDAPVRSSATR